jgi:hypothetical protein
VPYDRRLLVREIDAVELLSMSASTLRRSREADHFPGNEARRFGKTWFYAPDVLRDRIRDYWGSTTWHDTQED